MFRFVNNPGITLARAARQNGFSLIEVMVASAILGLTVAAVAAMITNASVFRTANDHNRQARIISQEELEDPAHHYRSYPVGDNGGPIQLDIGGEPVTLTANRSVTVATINNLIVSGVTIPQYQRIVSSITWAESGNSKTLTLKKRIAKIP